MKDLFSIFQQQWKNQLFEQQQQLIDPKMLQFYQIGLAIGIIFITTLSFFFFPGSKDPSVANFEAVTTTKEEIKQLSSKSSNQHDEGSEQNNNSNETTTSKDLMKEELIRLDQKRQRQRQRQREKETNNNNWTPHQRLNAIVYVIIIGIVMFILNLEYGGTLVFWFQRYFPKETAALLGQTKE